MDIKCVDKFEQERSTRSYVRVNFEEEIFYLFVLPKRPMSRDPWCYCFLKQNPVRRLVVDASDFLGNFHYMDNSYCNELFVVVGESYYDEDYNGPP